MASAAEITSDQHATTTGQHGKPKRADKTYGELENSVHAQISMPKAHKQASTPAVGAFAVGRPARTMRNVTPFERLPRRISSGDYSGKTYEPLERVNGKESVARVTAHTLSNPPTPATIESSSTGFAIQHSHFCKKPGAKPHASTKNTLLRQSNSQNPSTFSRRLRYGCQTSDGESQGKVSSPHGQCARLQNPMDEFRLYHRHYHHQSTNIEKESPRVLCFQLQTDAYRTECMEVLNRDLVVAHRQDDELLQNQCLIRTEGGVEFACETHTDLWFLCYRLLHWEGNAEETANMLSLLEPITG